MPVDVAMRIYISHSPPLCSFLSSYEDLRNRSCTRYRSNTQSLQQHIHSQQQQKQQQRSCQQQQQLYKPLRPCLSSSSQRPLEERQCLGWGGGKAGGTGNKKRVMFADSKGMSLTAIHLFSKYDDEPLRKGGVGGRLWSHDDGSDLQFDLSDLEGPAGMELRVSSSPSLALDFPQPASDYLDFRSRLLKNLVCLENCSLQERSLTGTVKVRNLGFEKEVRVRATFDSWSSHVDVECAYMNNVYGCQDNDTFAFVVELPGYVAPWERAEFCMYFRSGSQTHWDNNDGQNYRLKHLGWNGQDLPPPSATGDRKKPSHHRSGGVGLVEMNLDQFGSPRTSSGFFPEWQSWGTIESSVPYW